MARAWAGSRRAPEAPASLRQYRWRAPIYDGELLALEPVRSTAVALLHLQPGQVVLDVGCGTGLSFELLERGVGPRGRIVGIEQSPEMLALARERVERHGWQANVQLHRQPAGAVRLRGRGDAALFHFTHDILRDARALAHLMAHLEPGARVVASGLRWAPAWAVPVNAFVFLGALHSVTTLEGLAQPWDHLAQWLQDVELQSACFGAVYIASGRVRGRVTH